MSLRAFCPRFYVCLLLFGFIRHTCCSNWRALWPKAFVTSSSRWPQSSLPFGTLVVCATGGQVLSQQVRASCSRKRSHQHNSVFERGPAPQLGTPALEPQRVSFSVSHPHARDSMSGNDMLSTEDVAPPPMQAEHSRRGASRVPAKTGGAFAGAGMHGAQSGDSVPGGRSSTKTRTSSERCVGGCYCVALCLFARDCLSWWW